MAGETTDSKKSSLRVLGWIPVIMVLSFNTWAMGTITFGGPYAVIPLAAWLGTAYARKGWWAVLLGGLLLPLGPYLGPYRSGLHLDAYLIALLACHMAVSQRPLRDWLPAFDSKKLWVAAMVLLPLSVVFYDGELIDDLPIRLGFDLYGLFMLWLFAAGAAGQRARSVVIGLGAAAAVGMTLNIFGWPPKADVVLGARRAYLPVLGLTELRHLGVVYGLNSPLSWLTGIGYFWSGHVVARLMDKGAESLPSPRRACGWILLAGVIALSRWDVYVFSRVLHWPDYSVFNFVGSTPALLLVGLMAGVLLGRGGIWLAAGMVVVFWWLNGLVMSGFDFARPHVVFRLEEVLYAIGFGALGVRLRDLALGQETFLFSRRGALYTLLLGAIVLSVLLGNSPVSEKIILLGVSAAVVGLAALSRYLRKRVDEWRGEAHGAWVSLLGVIVLAAIAWQRAGEIAEAGHSMLKVLRDVAAVPLHDLAREVDGDMIFFVLFVLLYVWLFLTALQTLVKHLPAWIDDWKRLWAGLKSLFKPNAKIAVVFAPQKDKATDRAKGVIDRLVQSSRFVRRGVMILAIALPLTLLVIDVYPRKGLWAEIEDFYQDHIQAPSVIRNIPTECRERSPNPFLWQAAMEYIGDKPLIEADPCGYHSGRIKTDWFVSAQNPQQRTKLSIYLDDKLTEGDVSIFPKKQELRLTLIWVEIDTHDAERNHIEKTIFSRAETLAAKTEAAREMKSE